MTSAESYARNNPLMPSTAAASLSKNSAFSSPLEKDEDDIKQFKLLKKVLRVINHQIKFGQNFFSELIKRFTQVFKEKYSMEQSVNSSFIEPQARKSFLLRDPILLLADDSSPIKTKSRSMNMTVITDCSLTALDPQIILQKAIAEIKEFRTIIIALLTELIDCTLAVNWTPEVKRLLFEIANSVLFGINDQLHNSLMKLISAALGEKQEELIRKVALMKKMSPKDFEIHSNFQMEGESHPYLTVVEAFNMNRQHLTPEDKFRTRCATKTEIIKAIDSYWNFKDPNKTRSELELSADDLLPLYIYIISRSNVSRLLYDLYFIEEFLDTHLLNFTEDSYYFTTINAAVDYIISLSM